MLNAYERQLILDNPNLNACVLAGFIAAKSQTVTSFRFRNKIKSKWYHKGNKIPFLSVRTNDRYALDIYFRSGTLATSGSFSKAIKIVDHLIWCIELGMFDKPRIENPYLKNLKFGE